GAPQDCSSYGIAVKKGLLAGLCTLVSLDCRPIQVGSNNVGTFRHTGSHWLLGVGDRDDTWRVAASVRCPLDPAGNHVVTGDEEVLKYMEVRILRPAQLRGTKGQHQSQ